MNDEEKVQTEGIKQSIDGIIGNNTFLKKKRKTAEDKRREKFEKVIKILEALEVRSTILGTDLDVDLSQYDEKFHIVIDELLVLLFGEECYEIIFFYLYERLNPDGSINQLQDEKGQLINLLSPTDLWYFIKDVSTKNKKLQK